LSGRLVVYLIREGSAVQGEPADGPFFEDPQPMLGVDVQGWSGEGYVPLGAAGGAGVDRFPDAELPPGRYRVQAVLDRTRLDSRWQREPGNLSSSFVGSFELREGEAPVVAVHLDTVVQERADPRGTRAVFRRFESRLLSEARGERTFVDVGVVPPLDQREGHRYPVIYEIPGFGGDHRGAARRAAMLAEAPAGSPLGLIARHAYWVVLNPEGPNGHHLFMDSPANGPVGRALVQEVIPQLELIESMASEPAARLLRGHSSGGFTVVHLALAYPEVFGGAWSSAPDPLDFRAFQDVNIYEERDMFRRLTGEPRPSYTERDGTVAMTIAQENAMERVLGPLNTSGQQWDSWQAALGPVDEQGRPARLFDETTGRIDAGVAAAYRRADPAERVRRDPAGLGKLARDRLRIIVGDADEYDLDRGVELFAQTLGGFAFEGEGGWYAVVRGATHGSVLASEAGQRLMEDMAEHLDEHGFVPR
jgi:hypothetical protein